MAPEVSSLVVAGSRLRTDLAANVTSITRNLALGQVGELSVVAAGDKLIGTQLAKYGTSVHFGSGRYQVGAVEPDLGPPVLLTIRCRSTLARALRKTYKTKAEHKVSAGEWIRRRVHAHDGKVTVQPSAKKGTISQSGGRDAQSELDVIGSLASGAEWVWTERGEHLYVGQRWWFYLGGGSLAKWDLTWRKVEKRDVLTLSGVLSDDDKDNAATASMTVPYALGIRLAPLQRVDLSGAGVLNGTWLIENTTATLDGLTPVTVALTKPRRPSKKKGST